MYLQLCQKDSSVASLDHSAPSLSAVSHSLSYSCAGLAAPQADKLLTHQQVQIPGLPLSFLQVCSQPYGGEGLPENPVQTGRSILLHGFSSLASPHITYTLLTHTHYLRASIAVGRGKAEGRTLHWGNQTVLLTAGSLFPRRKLCALQHTFTEYLLIQTTPPPSSALFHR